jgi:hypothetical protein
LIYVNGLTTRDGQQVFSMSASLDAVKSYMGTRGWSDGGGPGSVKRDAHGKVVAGYGDATWIADIEEACVALVRLAGFSAKRPS